MLMKSRSAAFSFFLPAETKEPKQSLVGVSFLSLNARMMRRFRLSVRGKAMGNLESLIPEYFLEDFTQQFERF